ncbi:nucleoside phosphorylase-I family protein [Tessaracoccus antarcticus]|uniref:5'-methylthioadenosine/S-adenosylhomocysteine nucleosidase n=1 Tax=Tessaracoccus antarcticus TaxID=2479848 RepID=UPI0011C3B158|nr:5'-methylthioadenosine/S-adenosylhomocysteine nucleosidase [Tessaracoccus antarcticus]
MRICDNHPEGHLFGKSGRHARVVVLTVTDTEFPIARKVFGQIGDLVEIEDHKAYTPRQFADSETLPFVLVRTTDRGNLAISNDIAEWMRLFKPQAFIIVGTAGSMWRPVDPERMVWKGVPRGDVLVSEFVHFGDFRKDTNRGKFMRYHRIDQPSSFLLGEARGVINDPASWHRCLGENWADATRKPNAKEEEFLVGEQIQDDPLDATQQYLMHTFDRAAATEMESAGVGQALHSFRRDAVYAPLYISVRGVSDLIWARGSGGPLEGEADLEKARVSYSSQHDDVDGRAAASDDKTDERQVWSPRAAEAASAFALALVRRLVHRSVRPMSGHPEIPSFEISTVSGGS